LQVIAHARHAAGEASPANQDLSCSPSEDRIFGTECWLSSNPGFSAHVQFENPGNDDYRSGSVAVLK
jgi:hypothetical protein